MLAEHRAQAPGDLADGGPGQHGVDEGGHDVRPRARAILERGQGRGPRRGGPPAAQRAHALDLGPLQVGVDAQDVEGRILSRFLEFYPTDYLAKMYLERALEYEISPPNEEWNAVEVFARK